jgi:crotonobetainyl-CoA:carnitine CoA-transferase CaiB-like acyl-CoA transferase
MSETALDGVRVVELCNLAAGPYCTKLMADLGAEVIKVEKPGVGDEARRRGPFLNDIPHPERSALFLYLNTNKLGVTLNVETKKGKELLRELIAEADILVEDNPPGMLAGLGLGYEVLSELNPRLVMTSITPFGQTGRYKDYKAYPLNSFHSGAEGFITPTGDPFPDRPPLKVARYAGEYDAAIHSMLGTLGALYYQRATGLGQQVDVSKQEALIDINTYELLAYPYVGWFPNRATVLNPLGGIMPARDGHGHLAMYEEVQWDALANLMGNPEWTKEELYTNPDVRRQRSEEVQQRLREWMKERTKHEVYHEGQKAGVATGAYQTPEEIMKSEQLNSRGFFVELDHPEVGKVTYPTAPYRFSKTPWQGRRAAPLLGEHNEEVYHKRLGRSKEEVTRLRGLGVI